MGLFTRPALPGTTDPRHPLAVTVAFASVRDPDAGKAARQMQGYTYWWPFTAAPRVGTWVGTPTPTGPKAAIIVTLGTRRPPNGRDLSTLSRIIPSDEIRLHRAFEQAISADSLDQAIRIASPYPDHTPATPSLLLPFDGHARADMAGDYAPVWWRAYKRAEEHGMPTPAIEALHRVGSAWYAVHHEAVAQAIREHEE